MKKRLFWTGFIWIIIIGIFYVSYAPTRKLAKDLMFNIVDLTQKSNSSDSDETAAVLKGTDDEPSETNLPGTSPPPSSDSSNTLVPTEHGKRIKAIEYKGIFLPISQLVIENEAGCGAEHWHGIKKIVIAAEGSEVKDPGSPCGFGRVRDMLATVVE